MAVKNKKLSKILSVVTSILIVIMVLFIIFLTYCNISGRVAYIGKHAFVRVVTASMEPTIPTGGYILVEKVDNNNISNLKIGDIIMFYSHDPAISGKLNTHRIVNITVEADGTKFYTKGDNNPAVDSLTTKSEDIAGKYIKNLSSLSKIASFFRNKIVYFFLILIPSALLLMLCVIEISKKSKEIKMDALVAAEVNKLKKNDGRLDNSENDSATDREEK